MKIREVNENKKQFISLLLLADASVTGAGGSSYDNQALFDFEGNSLKSLQVFRNIYPQNNEILNPKGAVIENGRYRIKNVNSELFISKKTGTLSRAMELSGHSQKMMTTLFT